MKRLLIAAAATLALSACATATPYQPARSGASYSEGYSDYRIEDGRWRVGFAGNSVTSRETVEMYLLYRAAELTVQQGYDWFETVDRSTERETSYYGTHDPWWGGWGCCWSPSWRVRHGGAWGPWGPWGPWGGSYDVQQVNRYEAMAEVIMHKGPKPEGDRRAFDAREVMTNLGPKIVLPKPKS
jgi:hypothetical protein